MTVHRFTTQVAQTQVETQGGTQVNLKLTRVQFSPINHERMVGS